MEKNRRFYKILTLDILAVLAIGMLFFIDIQDITSFFEGDVRFIEPISPCDLHVDICKATLENSQDVLFEITPKHIPLMKPLTFKATIEGLNQDELPMKIYATNMNMGIHYFTLKKKDEKTFEARSVLPTCVVGNMIWRAEITIETPGKTTGAVFTFQTDK